MLENKYVNFDKQEADAILETLGTQRIAGTSETVVQYERKLSDLFNIKHAIAVSSGTSALYALLCAYNIGQNDEVIVSASAPVMSALPIIAVGATVVFADNEIESFGFDIEDLNRKITSRTKMIISVPMWGYAINSDEIYQLARDRNIPYIEDASHCHGATYRGKYIGTHGDAGFFSTQERKLISTGEGGFIVTENDHIANRLVEVRDFGKPVSDLSAHSKHIGEYGHQFGLNFRITALSSAIGMVQVDKLSKKIETRTKNAELIKNGLRNMGWLREIGTKPDSVPNYYSLLMLLDEGLDNCEVGLKFFEQGIVSDSYRFKIKPLYRMPIFSKFISNCPNTEQLLRRIVTLPTHEGLSEDDIARIVKAVKNIKLKEVI